jgi:hypothetical protein
VQRAAQVRAVVRKDVHGLALAQGQQAEVAELAAGGPPVGKLVQRAQVMPAEGGEVVDRLGVAGPGAEPQRQMAAQVGADGGDRQPAGGQQLAVAVPSGRPGQQRGAEQGRRPRL